MEKDTISLCTPWFGTRETFHIYILQNWDILISENKTHSLPYSNKAERAKQDTCDFKFKKIFGLLVYIFYCFIKGLNKNILFLCIISRIGGYTVYIWIFIDSFSIDHWSVCYINMKIYNKYNIPAWGGFWKCTFCCTPKRTWVLWYFLFLWSTSFYFENITPSKKCPKDPSRTISCCQSQCSGVNENIAICPLVADNNHDRYC